MSEAIEVIADLKAESAARRKSNRERSSQMLVALGVEFETRNDGAHLIVKHNGVTVDFWPGTGKYITRRTSKHGRGVFNLLKLLGIDPKAAKGQQ
jgi:hypothetical protein